MTDPAGRLRVALVADLLSERWPSMDLVADMLFAHLRSGCHESLRVELLRPDLPQRGGLQRYVARYWGYSRWLRNRARDFDVFHVIDHSYAHLVHVLPPERTVVTCHDADAFMPLVGNTVITSRLPKAVTRRILSGMRRAARITCVSAATRDELLAYRLTDNDKLIVVPNGVDDTMTAEPGLDANRAVSALIGAPTPEIVDVLHVGSSIPRKRIDVLLRVFRAVRDVEPRARLLKAGGALTSEQLMLAKQLEIDAHIVQVPFLDTRRLAALYRRARVVLVPSEREGFGLPVVEALAAGVPVLATDLPVLREVGGTAASYAPLGDVEHWVRTIMRILGEHESAATREQTRTVGRSHVARFTWHAHAAAHSDVYRTVAAEAGVR